MTGQLLITPMTPAAAMAPMPMLFAYPKICSGDASAAVIAFPESAEPATAKSGNMIAIPGTMTHQTKAEPTQIIAAYYKPTIYPIPSKAALVLMLKTTFALSAKVCPHSAKRLVKFSFHAPKVATMKS